MAIAACSPTSVKRVDLCIVSSELVFDIRSCCRRGPLFGLRFVRAFAFLRRINFVEESIDAQLCDFIQLVQVDVLKKLL